MTTATATRTRTSIVNEAKRLVLHHGPANILEFGSEIVNTSVLGDQEQVLREAICQARRVYKFLGYDAPIGW